MYTKWKPISNVNLHQTQARREHVYIPPDAWPLQVQLQVYRVHVDMYGEKLILFFLSKICRQGGVNFKCMEKMHNDLNVICLDYCFVISLILKELQALQKKYEEENVVQ